MKTSQTKLILRHLAKGHSLTKLDALHRFGCWNLGGRIYDLKQERWPIRTERVTTKSGKRIARYSIPGARGN